jgi:hypothetical protein
MKRWKDAAKYCRREYGVHVDNGEEFFICPDCGEPLYADDWDDYKNWDECPVCAFNFKEGE